jgi:hypothetical protein
LNNKCRRVWLHKIMFMIENLMLTFVICFWRMPSVATWRCEFWVTASKYRRNFLPFLLKSVLPLVHPIHNFFFSSAAYPFAILTVPTVLTETSLCLYQTSRSYIPDNRNL